MDERKKLVQKQQNELRNMEKELKKKKGFMKDEYQKKIEQTTLDFEKELADFDSKSGVAAGSAPPSKDEKEKASGAPTKIFAELDFANLSKTELEEECGRRGLGKKGSKEQLVTKLVIFTQEQNAATRGMNEEDRKKAIAEAKPKSNNKRAKQAASSDDDEDDDESDEDEPPKPLPPKGKPAPQKGKPPARKAQSDDDEEDESEEEAPKPPPSKGKPAPSPQKGKPAPKKPASSDDDDDDDDDKPPPKKLPPPSKPSPQKGKPPAKKQESDDDDESEEEAKPKPAAPKGKPAPAPAPAPSRGKPAPKKQESDDDEDEEDEDEDEKAERERFAKREKVVQQNLFKLLERTGKDGIHVEEVADKLAEMGIKNFRPDVVGYKSLHTFFDAQPDVLLRYEPTEQMIYPAGERPSGLKTHPKDKPREKEKGRGGEKTKEKGGRDKKK